MEYQTQDLPFAAYLAASRKLCFLRCELANRNGRLAFVFDDPKGEGDRLQIEFESGAECPAAGFYDSVRHLRRVMDGKRSNWNKGAIRNEYDQGSSHRGLY